MPDRGPVEVRIEANDHRATVSVRDSGPGIPPEEQALIFEPFYRVDKSRARATGGYGLGLSLVKKIMTAHHGDIAVSSESGKGSTFTLIFPLSKSHAVDARELRTRSARASGSSHPEPHAAP
jgi:two-component system phosphate regulon sensor histidine kinase PhoR